MPRRKKGAHLWLRPERRSGGRVTASAVWVIIDGKKHIATGCFKGENKRAEQKLAAYIAGKYTPKRKEQDIEKIPIADVLSIYLDDTIERQMTTKKFEKRIERLNEFWGAKVLSDVSGETCREYETWRGNAGGARRDLEDLRAAIRHHAKQGFHRGIVWVTLPAKGLPRDRWLTRSEAAKLLWVCWRAREQQRRFRGASTGEVLPTDKRPLRHLARFILIGLYTGTRAASIAAASPTPDDGRSFVDLDAGIFYRLQQGKRASNKRQTPVPIPERLLAHMRRWHAKGIAKAHFVEWNGQAVMSVKTAFASAVEKAGIDIERSGNVTPHTLRHTAATWLMLNGVSTWKAAGFLGMSEKTLREVYGHHHPDYLGDAADAIGQKPKRRERLVVSLVEERKRRGDAV